MENWINNERGIVISKEKIIHFDEKFDHGDNLKVIIGDNYSQYSDYIDNINVFNGPMIISNEDDITILHTFGAQYQVYIPDSLNRLNRYQHNELERLLSCFTDPSLLTIAGCPRLDDIDKPMNIYKADELILQLKEVENNIKL